MTKTFEIKDGDISDGYHTFGELYDHRCVLYIGFVQGERFRLGVNVYCVQDHYKGWDLIVVEYQDAKQVSYHVPVKFRELYQSIPVVDESEHKFDGHTSKDVLERLQESIRESDARQQEIIKNSELTYG